MKTTMLQRALEWLDANRAQFMIVNELSHPYYSIKPVAELAEAAELLSRSAMHRERGRKLLEHAWEQLRHGDLISLLVKGPETLVQAAIYMPFHRAGFRNAALEAKIVEQAKAATAAPPLHRLPIAATLQTIGAASPWPLADVIRDEWNARMSSPFSLSVTDLYMATHIAFYASDYGRNPNGLAEEHREFLSRWIPVWLDELGSHGQLDLVAELIIAAHCAGPACVAPSAWKTLAAQQRPDGAVPYQTNDTRQVGVPGMPPEREAFLRVYHSTLVTIMGAALCTHAEPVS